MLGVISDEGLTWNEHVMYLYQKASIKKPWATATYSRLCTNENSGENLLNNGGS